MTGDIAAAVGAGAFWAFIATVVVAGVASGALRHHETQKTIRKAIESGQNLDPQTIERLLQSERPKAPPRRLFLVLGIILLALAGGLAVIGWATSQIHPDQLYPGLGAGALVGLLGLGFLAAGLLVMTDPPGNGRG